MKPPWERGLLPASTWLASAPRAVSGTGQAGASGLTACRRQLGRSGSRRPTGGKGTVHMENKEARVCTKRAPPSPPQIRECGVRTFPSPTPSCFDTGRASQALTATCLSPSLWDKMRRLGLSRRGGSGAPQIPAEDAGCSQAAHVAQVERRAKDPGAGKTQDLSTAPRADMLREHCEREHISEYFRSLSGP